MQPNDLNHLRAPGEPQLHPDGVRIAYVVTGIDLEDDRYHRSVHVWDGRHHRAFTRGPGDVSPRWSPDGRWLAFVRTEEGEGARPQLEVMSADGGEADRRTALPLGVTEIAWSPDSSHLVVVGCEYRPELADLDDEERARRPRRITELPYRSDIDGWIHERVLRLWIVDATGEVAPTQLASTDLATPSPAWRPDGGSIAFLSYPPERDEFEPTTQPFTIELESGVVRPAGPAGSWSWVGYAPDGTLHLAGLERVEQWPGVPRLFRCRPEGSSWRLNDLTGHLDRSVLPNSPAVVPAGPRFVDDGFLIAAEGRGTTGIMHIGDDGTAIEIVGGARCITGFTARADGGAVAFTVTDPTCPGELVWLDRAAAGREVALTSMADGFRAVVDVRPTERSTFVRDGTDLDVWAVLPAGLAEAPPRSVPVLFTIHGGPTAQYADSFFDEFQVGAGAGYLVVGTNPRGSSGRGTDWARAVVGAWTDEGSIDTLDLEAVVDAVLDRYPAADPGRVGVMGGSYGGYATARLLARTDRYRSAIVERGLLQWESFAGTSDIGHYFDRMFLGVSLGDDAGPHRQASPVATAARIVTPTLVLHSEADWRCPIEQGEQLFVALKRAGVDTEMVRFPGEGHELSRSGSPRHRQERFEIVLDWHARHLGPPVPAVIG